jgi:hypothetical protein
MLAQINIHICRSLLSTCWADARAEPNLMHCRSSAKFAFVMQLSARPAWKCKRRYTHAEIQIGFHTHTVIQSLSTQSASRAFCLCHQSPAQLICSTLQPETRDAQLDARLPLLISVCAFCISRLCFVGSCGDEALRFLLVALHHCLIDRAAHWESD